MGWPDDGLNVRYLEPALNSLDSLPPVPYVAEIIAIGAWLYFNPEIDGETKFFRGVSAAIGVSIYRRVYEDGTYWLYYDLEDEDEPSSSHEFVLKVFDCGLSTPL